MEREVVFAELRKALHEVHEFNNRYTGTGLLFIVKKVLRYRFKYTAYLFARSAKLNVHVKPKTIFGTRIRLPLRDPETLPLYLFGTLSADEWKLMAFFIRYTKSSDVVYDIGANYGFYSQLVSTLGAKKTFAFEPNPRIATMLKENLHSMNGARMVKKAVGETKGSITFHLQKVGSANSTLNAQVIAHKRADFESMVVEVITLDAFVNAHPAPTIIKIDIEGAELQALIGAKNTIARFKPVFTLEVWSGEKGEMYSMPAVQYLHSFGYRAFDVNNEGFLVEMKVVNPRNFENAHAQNIIFIHNDCVESFSARA